MENRRQDILDAALEVFLEHGFDSATMSAIRERSGASTGSIYHFFGSKAEMAAALLQAATSEWSLHSQALGMSDDAEQAVKASVSGFLQWGQQNPRLFAFMDDMLARSRFSVGFEPAAVLLDKGRQAAAAAYARWVSEKRVRDLPWDVAYALIMGPAYAVLRNSAGARIPEENIAELARSAWLSVARHK